MLIKLVLLAALLGTFAKASETRVIDGDTLEVGSTKVRLFGIDAPEYGQKCSKRKSGVWPCGKEATQFLVELIGDQQVTCVSKGIDNYDRQIGVCSVGDLEINASMVSSGMAWAFVKYSTAYVSLEKDARKTGLGVWQAETETPWKYRSHRWGVAIQKAPEGCPIKGNISKKGEKIYHTPWSPWYKRTKISINKGERWFCDEAEAVAAGWRSPMWGG